MDNKNIIFIAGVHGVGKTTFAKKKSMEKNINYYSSSKLIEKAKGELFKDKLAKDIENNQELLIKAVEIFIKEESILDGHFCLLNSDFVITKISMDTYERLGLKSIIVLVDDVCSIVERLEKRDCKKYNIDLIEEFQLEEISYAKEVSKKLDIPINIIDLSK